MRCSITALITFATQLSFATPGQAQSRAFVQTIGKDTISVEQYTRTGNTITGTWLTTYGGMTVHDYVLTLRPDRTVEHARVSVRRVSGQILGEIDLSFGHDSAVAVVTGDSTTTKRIAVSDAFPILGQTAAMWEAALMHQRATKQDSAVVPMVIAFDGQAGRTRVAVAGDSARIAAWRFAIDGEGGILGGAARLTPAIQPVLRRVASVDLHAAVKTFPDIPASVPLENASYYKRDTAAATLGSGRITIDYSRAYRSGRDVFKRGILGDTIWRTGNYAATQFSSSADLIIAGKVLPAGTYSLWTHASRKNDVYELVFNRQVRQWGTEHDFSQDVLVVPLKASALASPVDPFTIAIEPDGEGAVLMLRWATTQLSTPLGVR